MDANERESINNKIAELEVTVATCTAKIDAAQATVDAFKAKRARVRKDLADLKRRLKAEE